MKIHHINCGTFCPAGGRLVSGEGSIFSKAEMVCHCLLIETEQGLVIVDTGLGMQDILNNKRLSTGFKLFAKPVLQESETAIYQVKQLGFSPDDVKHIILTHLDPDHGGGLADFPKAKIHVFEDEFEAAMQRKTHSEKERYNPMMWEHNPLWEKYQVQGENWNGFESVRELRGLPSEILMVPLIGHTRGHCAVAINTANGWLLHAGDAYFHHHEIDSAKRSCPFGLEIFQAVMQVDKKQRMYNQSRLRKLKQERNSEINIFCSHDPFELKKLKDASISQPSF